MNEETQYQTVLRDQTTERVNGGRKPDPGAWLAEVSLAEVVRVKYELFHGLV